jgi:hypothetical protein
MQLPDTKSEGNSADNDKLSRGFQAIYIANQMLDMFRTDPNVPDLIKLTSSEQQQAAYILKIYPAYMVSYKLNYEANILISNALGCFK